MKTIAKSFVNDKSCFMPNHGVVVADTFSEVYPLINNYINNSKEYEDCRDGKVKELLDFKTKLTNPYRRCVGGYGRNINVFFLLAEAMWIALGRKDVEFLTIFNKRMANFSDDGVTFHAPYGYRLRHWGVRTEDSFLGDNLNASKGYDQVIDAIRLLSENPNTRQVVMSIWNPNYDLGYKTKDTPCNDMIMLKIRKGKLITTIQNRSNDLHWGLPTNLFQFSFLTELMAASLGIELGTQTHNSQSLHVYDWNKITQKMDENLNAFKEGKDSNMGELYSHHKAEEKKIDFKFKLDVAVNRFHEIEFHMVTILNNITKLYKEGKENEDEIDNILRFSKYFYSVYQLLKVYVLYKREFPGCKDDNEKDELRLKSIEKIDELSYIFGGNWDVLLLARNFFLARLNNKEQRNEGKL